MLSNKKFVMASQLYVLRNMLLLNNCKILNNYFRNFPLNSCTTNRLYYYATNVKNHKLFFSPNSKRSISINTIIINNNNYKKISNKYIDNNKYNDNNYRNINNILSSEIMSQKRFFHDGNIVSTGKDRRSL